MKVVITAGPTREKIDLFGLFQIVLLGKWVMPWLSKP